MGYYEIVVYGLAILIVAVIILAEIVHAYRSKSVRTLYNRYTLALILSILLFVYRLTSKRFMPELPALLIFFDYLIIDYISLILLNIYVWFRGGLLVGALFGKRHSFETKMPYAERKKMCRFCIWTLGVYFIITRAGAIIVIWPIDVFGN